MYNNFNELMAGFVAWRDKQNDNIPPNSNEGKDFRRLFIVYFDAQDNPPDGIIGVGAITYAEHKLREAQSRKDKTNA